MSSGCKYTTAPCLPANLCYVVNDSAVFVVSLQILTPKWKLRGFVFACALFLRSAVLLKTKKHHVRRSVYHWENTNTFCRSKTKSPCALNTILEVFSASCSHQMGGIRIRTWTCWACWIFCDKKMCVKYFDYQVNQESSLHHKLFCSSFLKKLRLAKWRKDQ